MRIQPPSLIVALIAVHSWGCAVLDQHLAAENTQGAASGGSAVQPKHAALQAELDRIAAASSGTVGLCAIHVQSGETVGVNMDDRFPMASTYKVPIAVQMLYRVQRGEVRLDDMITFRPQDQRPASDLSFTLGEPGAQVSLRNLLYLMLRSSDNAASDLVLKSAGGPQAVTARLRALGINDMQVDRSTLQSLLACAGHEDALADNEFTWAKYKAIQGDESGPAAAAAMRTFADDPRDSSTPKAMAELLAMLSRGQALDESNTMLLQQIMIGSAGATRIRGMLPASVPPRPAHKTGTLIAGGLCHVNDVGIVHLPVDQGDLAIAVFIKSAALPASDTERIIADLTRTVVDAFILNES